MAKKTKKSKSSISGVGAIFYRQFNGKEDKDFRHTMLIPDVFSVYEYVLYMMNFYKQPRLKDDIKFDLLQSEKWRKEAEGEKRYEKIIKENRAHIKIAKLEKSLEVK